MTPGLDLDVEKARRTLSYLIERFALRRGNWEVDYPEMVEAITAMAEGRSPLCGRFAAVAADETYAFIEVMATEEEALEQLGSWTVDELYPKTPLALADLHRGAVFSVEVTVSRGSRQAGVTEESAPC